jgi:prespore-specific regulator
MTATRQDAWTPDDDLLLAEVTLRHIREGSTQLAAFEEVGQKLGRTSAACGFRWNSAIRKKYEAAIQIAKAQRQQLKKSRRKNAVEQPELKVVHDVEMSSELGDKTYALDEEISFDAVIRFLKNQKDHYKKMKLVEKELAEKNKEIERLRSENEKMRKELESMKTDYQVVNDDYKALIQIMDRARKMAFLTDEDMNVEEKPRFKMDANGNLERVDYR